ncbi:MULTISPECIES: SHOCT domain-containing protein [Colwellia]|uniref:SHOCT domain-containing protein n=1 Tax=Colwellia marinimaniae TaxID=1513592 RepID=A0ABQ0MRK4_9GAMM|nr:MULTISPECIES: SHOCT domain-containing protein [Colwellia]GAW94995.1 hypothetical protein MTCD1_00594 [Colwellia marinimaniae]
MLTVKHSLFLFFFLWLVLFTRSSHANNSTSEKNQYLLQKIAQAPLLKGKNSQWLQLLEQPGNSQNYYLANRQGQIYQLAQDNAINSSLLLDFQQVSTKEPILQLSAFALHPNFALNEHSGYGIFYTAHVEKSPTISRAKRLQESAVTIALSFDAVVTEWQLNPARQVDISSQREVLRIAIASVTTGIKQLSFNPYSKSWHDDFAQLYIALAQNQKLSQYPLYSGAILRINPQEITTASYSVPDNNPYFAHNEISAAIYLLGAGQIKQFIWPDKYSNKLLISHLYRYKNTIKHWLSYSYGGEDWRAYSPKQFIYQNDQPLTANSLLVYRGQNAPSLRNKLLLLTKKKRQWQLSSLTNGNPVVKLGVQQQKSLSTPQLEWPLSQQKLITKQLSIFRDNRGELLFFNEDSGAIYQLFQQDIMPGQGHIQGNQATKQSGLAGITFFFISLFTLLAGYIFYQINSQKNSVKSLVRREFSHLALTDDKLALNLFKRHQHKTETVVALDQIKQCQLLLGDLVIATINTTLAHGFNDQQEQALREIFHNEKIDKMVDGKVRRISLSINTSKKNKYIICLYLRKGNDRITKNSYFAVVDDVINWCWLIAAKINSQHTSKRGLKASISAADIALAEHKSHDDTPLHTQAAIIRPATHPQPTLAVNEQVPTAEIPIAQGNSDAIILSNYHDSTAITAAKVETELVNALEKLVKLQQQGFLSADEFSQAKAKLLDCLNKTE